MIINYSLEREWKMHGCTKLILFPYSISPILNACLNDLIMLWSAKVQMITINQFCFICTKHLNIKNEYSLIIHVTYDRMNIFIYSKNFIYWKCTFGVRIWQDRMWNFLYNNCTLPRIFQALSLYSSFQKLIANIFNNWIQGYM